MQHAEFNQKCKELINKRDSLQAAWEQDKSPEKFTVYLTAFDEYILYLKNTKINLSKCPICEPA